MERLPTEALYHCDNTAHGYGCFHLDPDLSNLTKDEQYEWTELTEAGYEYESMDEIERDLKRATQDVAYKEAELFQAQGEEEDIERYKELFLKKHAVSAPVRQVLDAKTTAMFS